MSKKLDLKIETPSRTMYADKVDQVTVTTTSGEITILSNHVPLISQLSVGQVVVKMVKKIFLLPLMVVFLK